MISLLSRSWTCSIIFVVTSLTLVLTPFLATAAVPSISTGFAFTEIQDSKSGTTLTPLPTIDRDAVDEVFGIMEDTAYSAADTYAAPRFLFDELIDFLEYEPEKAFEFVRDEIGFDPYVGILRDAEGTLGGGAGNAYDKSLLLKRLLDDMGFDTRLVFGELDEENARSLLTQVLAAQDEPYELWPLASMAGLSDEIQNRMLDRARRDYQWLTSALDDADYFDRTPSSPYTLPRAHVWVQARIGSDWDDLDPSFAGAEIGQSFADVQRYSADAEEDARHSVKIAVVAEQVTDDGLKEQVLLEHKMVAANATNRRIYLTFAPTNSSMGGALGDALRMAMELKPVLVIDGEYVSGDVIPGIGAPSSAAGDFFYGDRSSNLSALYVDVTVGVAGTDQSSSRGVMLDRLPSSVRRGDAPKADDLKPMESDDDYPVFLKTIQQVVVSNGGRNPRLDAEALGLAIYYTGEYLFEPGYADDLPLDSLLWPAAIFRSAQIGVNEQLMRTSLNDGGNARFFIGEPRVYLYGLSFRGLDDEAELGMSIDLLHDPIHVATRDGEGRATQQRRIWHGVIQSSFENTVIEIPRLGTPDLDDMIQSASTYSTGSSVVLKSQNDRRLPADAPNALTQDLARGSIVATSEDATDSGWLAWWSVAADGTTRAMLSPARGGGEWFTRMERFSSHFRQPRPTSGQVKTIDMLGHAEQIADDQNAMRRAARSIDRTTRATANNRYANYRGVFPRGKSGGGGNEYGTTMHVSIWSVLGTAGILAYMVVGIAILGCLYMIGVIIVTERRRQERGY